MTQSLTRVISLHLQSTNKCSLSCPHKKICYHHNRECGENIGASIFPLVESWLNNYEVHFSLCDLTEEVEQYINKWSSYKNFFITVSSKMFSEKLKNLRKDVFQISVYSLADVLKFKDYTKIFLIKDQDSLEKALDLTYLDEDIGNLHLAVDFKFAKESVIVSLLVGVIDAIEKNKNITLDSTLMNYIQHGKDAYVDDYIDINLDGTIRRSPFIDVGVEFDFKKDIKEAFNIIQDTKIELYAKLLGEE